MAITIGLTDVSTTVLSALDIDYPITPAHLGAGSFSGTDEINVYYDRFSETISAALNGGEIIDDIYTSVDEDLKPASFSDVNPAEITVNRVTLTDENSYKFTDPLPELRFNFLNSDFVSDGSLTNTSVVETGTLTYDGKSIVPADASSYVTLTPKIAGTYEVRTIIIVFEKFADDSVNKTLIDPDTGINYGRVFIDSSNNLKFLINTTGDISTNTTYVSDGIHSVIINTQGSSSGTIYYDGLEIGTFDSSNRGLTSEYKIFRNTNGTDQSDMKIHKLVLTETNFSTVDTGGPVHKDIVKSGLINQDYVENFGLSRVINVRTTPLNGDEFTTTQDAVDAIFDANETVIVFDGISPAFGGPPNVQVIDLAVSPLPEFSTWETWPFGTEIPITVTGTGTLATTDSKFTDTIAAVMGNGLIVASTVVAVDGSMYIKAQVTGSGTITESIFKESLQTPTVSGVGTLSPVFGKSVEVLSALVNGVGTLDADLTRTAVLVSSVSATGNITASLSYQRYHKAVLTGLGSISESLFKDSNPVVNIDSVGSLVSGIAPDKFTSSVTTGTGTLFTKLSEDVTETIFFNGLYDVTVDYTYKIKI